MNWKFDWDPLKAKRNILLHGVSFKTATEVFFDPDAIHFDDHWHSTQWEERDLVIGLSRKGILLVVYTERRSTFRIITARRAGPEERRLYEDQKNRL
jgi:uncharacterized DUF497 family protein